MTEPRIEGLSPRQFELLEMLWQFEELEEMEAWKVRLSPRDQRMVDQLIRMILVETFDQYFMQESEYPEANAVIQRIMKDSRNGT